MDINTVSLIVGFSGPLTGLIIYLLGLRKVRAEAAELEARARELESQSQLNRVQEADTFAEATGKFLTNQEKLQDENTELYNRVVALEKMLTDADRSKQALVERLNDRDSQLKTVSEHLRTLQDKAKQTEITNALVTQQQAIIEIARSYQSIIEDRERTFAAREETFKEIAARTGPLPDINKKR